MPAQPIFRKTALWGKCICMRKILEGSIKMQMEFDWLMFTWPSARFSGSSHHPLFSQSPPLSGRIWLPGIGAQSREACGGIQELPRAIYSSGTGTYLCSSFRFVEYIFGLAQQKYESKLLLRVPGRERRLLPLCRLCLFLPFPSSSSSFPSLSLPLLFLHFHFYLCLVGGGDR